MGFRDFVCYHTCLAVHSEKVSLILTKLLASHLHTHPIMIILTCYLATILYLERNKLELDFRVLLVSWHALGDICWTIQPCTNKTWCLAVPHTGISNYDSFYLLFGSNLFCLEEALVGYYGTLSMLSTRLTGTYAYKFSLIL